MDDLDYCNYYILRYGEIALKGKNRKSFEQQLISNIRSYIRNRYNAESKFKRIRGRLVLLTSAEPDLRPIFGLTSYSKAIKISNKLEQIKDSATKLFNDYKNNKTINSFKIETYRLDKSYELISPEINKIIGAAIHDKFKTSVDLKNPELILGIEIHKDCAYLFTENIQCFSGLPVASSDDVYLFFDNTNRSIFAALELMKRGCKVILINKNKNIATSKLLELYNNYFELETAKEINNKEAFASPAHINKIHKEQNFTLYPVALLSDKEVDEELKKYDILKT